MSQKKVSKICEHCNNEYMGFNKSKFCSTTCRGISQRIEINFTCHGCKNTFLISRAEALSKIYCSRECYLKHYVQKKGIESPNYKKVIVYCSNCNKKIEKHPSSISRTEKHYCSKECLYFSKIEKYKTGKDITCSSCDKLFYRNNFRINKNEFNYCSRECTNKGFSERFSGKNSIFYNPEKTEEERVKQRKTEQNIKWRTSVFKRDNYTCQICFCSSGGNLNAHHFKNYTSHKEERFNLSNGVTLCKKCHKSFHDKYGYTENNKSQFEEFKSSYTIKS